MLITIIWSPKNVSPKNDQLIQTYFPQALHSAFFSVRKMAEITRVGSLCPLNFAQFFIDLLQDFCSLKSGSTWLKFCQISYDSLCMRHSKNPIHSQVFVKILLKAPLISKVNYDNALFIITKLTTYRSSAFSAAGQEDMRSIVQFLLRDGASGVAVENCLIEQWTLVCRGAELW